MARKKRTQDAPLSEPQTRVERYLAKTAGLTDDVSQLNQPRTRLERYLAKIAGLIEEAPAAPETRLERYLDAIVQGGGGGGGGPEGLGNALIFTSPSDFTLRVNNNAKNWDGVLEWTNGQNDWEVWDGTAALQSYSGFLALRGTGNSIITGSYTNRNWILTGSNIRCDGNIETLLNYQSVANGINPTMGNSCFYFMFRSCHSLIKAPDLPATVLSQSCYMYMFEFCDALTAAPALPATTLATYCYGYMFHGCTALTSAPALPAITLAENCYNNMFNGCTALTSAPALPATTLANGCYNSMFTACSSLVTPPALPATTLANNCYTYMFTRCTSLTSLPVLPATALTINCYEYMFLSCLKIKVSATKIDEYQYEYRIPSEGTGTVSTSSLSDMFRNTGGTYTSNPVINTTYYTDHPPVAA